MALELYQRAILTVDIPADKLRAGDVGTLVEKHDVLGVPEVGYSVEFFDMTGRTIAVVTVPASNLREPTTQDLLSARVVSGAR